MVESYKPRVFVGSSTEGLSVAEVVAGNLVQGFEVQLWSQGLFRLGHYPMEDLERAVLRCDFAVLVGTPDDVLIKRSTAGVSVRDNVAFELGLFMGGLGRNRAVLVAPAEIAECLPSDIKGLTRVQYDWSSERPLIGEALTKLQRAAREVQDGLLVAWGEELRRRELERTSLLRSERVRAAQLLHKALTTLRDLFIEAPGQLLGAAKEHRAFEAAKDAAIVRLWKHHRKWEADAAKMEVAMQWRALVQVADDAVRELPYPIPLVDSGEAVSLAGDLITRAARTGSVGKGVSAILDGASEEAAHRIQAVVERYVEWWAKAGGKLRDQTADLHDTLTSQVALLALDAEARWVSDRTW